MNWGQVLPTTVCVKLRSRIPTALVQIRAQGAIGRPAGRTEVLEHRGACRRGELRGRESNQVPRRQTRIVWRVSRPTGDIEQWPRGKPVPRPWTRGSARKTPHCRGHPDQHGRLQRPRQGTGGGSVGPRRTRRWDGRPLRLGVSVITGVDHDHRAVRIFADLSLSIEEVRGARGEEAPATVTRVLSHEQPETPAFFFPN